MGSCRGGDLEQSDPRGALSEEVGSKPVIPPVQTHSFWANCLARHRRAPATRYGPDISDLVPAIVNTLIVSGQAFAGRPPRPTPFLRSSPQ